jgi:imidazolonepropionase
MHSLFTNIDCLYGVHQPSSVLRGAQLALFPSIENAFLHVVDGNIHSFGKMSDCHIICDTEINLAGSSVLPTYVDSHTHAIFAGSRESEFVAKLKGKTYAEIAAEGGGILQSAKKLQATSEDELFAWASTRLHELILLGTGAIEIKSGYGLTVEAELKMLRVIRRLKDAIPIPIKATLLAAHAIPNAYKENPDLYIDLIIKELLPEVASQNLADFVDVFCEKGFFTPKQMQRIVEAAAQYNIPAKLHINQLNSIGGLQTAVSLQALSVDHLETMTEEDISCLAASNTIGTLLPTAAYFLRMPLQQARQLIDANTAIAIASDYNPGSSPSGNMNTVVSMSCIQMKMLPEEAFNAATINGAFAMQVADEVGSIAIGKRANFFVTEPIPSLAYIPYSFGSNLIKNVYINGTMCN